MPGIGVDVFSDADIIVVAAGICSTELFVRVASFDAEVLAVVWVGVSDGA